MNIYDFNKIGRNEKMKYSIKIRILRHKYERPYQHVKLMTDHHISRVRKSIMNVLPANWEQIKNAVLKRDMYRCKMCGRMKYLHVHHKVPRASGGSHEISNLITLCVRCHSNQHPTNAQLRAMADKLVGK